MPRNLAAVRGRRIGDDPEARRPGSPRPEPGRDLLLPTDRRIRGARGTANSRSRRTRVDPLLPAQRAGAALHHAADRLGPARLLPHPPRPPCGPRGRRSPARKSARAAIRTPRRSQPSRPAPQTRPGQFRRAPSEARSQHPVSRRRIEAAAPPGERLHDFRRRGARALPRSGDACAPRPPLGLGDAGGSRRSDHPVRAPDQERPPPRRVLRGSRGS